MANTMRWRYGDTNPVVLPVAEGVAVEIGDLVYLDQGEAKPASALPDQGSALLNQYEFQDYFVGVAMQASPAGEASSIRIATSGVFEFDAAAEARGLGALVGVETEPSGDRLYDQRVETATEAAYAIGRAAKQDAAASSRVLVDIVSTVMRGGPQTPA